MVSLKAGGKIDDISVDTMLNQVLLRMQVTVAPFPRGCIRTADEECRGDSSDADERHDKSHAPRDMSAQVLVRNQRIEDSGHKEVRDPSSRISEAARESIGSADDVLVKEARRPHLAGHERPTQDADEETESEEALDIRHRACQCGWNGTGKQTGGEGVSRTISITGWARGQPHKESAQPLASVALSPTGDAYVATKEMMFEFAISVEVRPKSLPMVTVKSGGKAYLVPFESAEAPYSPGAHMHALTVAYQDQKARKKPNHANVKTRPYTLMGFNPGMVRALRLMGLTCGAFHSVVTSNMAAVACGASGVGYRSQASCRVRCEDCGLGWSRRGWRRKRKKMIGGVTGTLESSL